MDEYKTKNGLYTERTLVTVLRVLSTEMRQVFRAYTKQLKTPSRDEEKKSESLHMRKGYEQVDLSEEAMKLAASEQEAVEPRPEPTNE